MQRLSPGPTALAIAAIAILGAAGCDSASSPAAPTSAVATVIASASSNAGTISVAVLEEALQDEYHAENVYARVLRDFGTVFPFANIINAERAHAASIATLMTNRSWAVPASAWTPDNVPAFASVSQACAAAATAEIENVKLYDRYLALGSLPADVRIVFENNRRASQVNHLPAFERCR